MELKLGDWGFKLEDGLSVITCDERCGHSQYCSCARHRLSHEFVL